KMTFVAALRDNTTGLVWGQYRVDIDPGTEERLPFLAYITNSCYTPLVLRARSLKGEFLIGEWLQPPSAAKSLAELTAEGNISLVREGPIICVGPSDTPPCHLPPRTLTLPPNAPLP